MTTYVCYDIKGIQSFIFRIPKLKYIIGGSAIIDRFDREFAISLNNKDTICLFAGGGRGAFEVKDEVTAKELQQKIITEAHRFGLDVRFGVNKNYSEAAQQGSDLHPYLPKHSEMEGHPCNMSGLYPVSAGKGKGVGGANHATIERRIFDHGDKMSRYFEDRLLDGLDLGLELKPEDVCFLSNVDIEDESGRAGAAALGNRNRWAVIAMDGNDMGSQFRQKDTTSDLKSWIKPMSAALDSCSFRAAQSGIEKVVGQWMLDTRHVEMRSLRDDGKRVLPIRPLVVGGDDLIVLCHSQYAFDFVQAAMQAFENESIARADEYRRTNAGSELWPATSGRVTISAGILFASTKLPLHLALPYTELLLASAKGRGRELAKTGDPSPACLDWEQATETLLDMPTDRRNRELRFMDQDIEQEINLTCRPYSIEDFTELRKWAMSKKGLQGLPNSIVHSLRDGLSAGYWDRQIFAARNAKNWKMIEEVLAEEEEMHKVPVGSRWKLDKECRRTDLLDAVLIHEECSRMEGATV